MKLVVLRLKKERFLEKIVEFDDGDYMPLKKLADLYFENKNYKKAAKYYHSVFFRNPYDIQSHKNAEKCYNILDEKALAKRENNVIKALTQLNSTYKK